MFAAIGVVILLVMVFGGFALTGGALGPVMHAIPHEMLIIGGAAIGATVTGNSLHELKALGGGFAKLFKGPKHNKQDHIDAIILTTRLMKLLRSEGPVAMEGHVQDPPNSAIFAEFPRLLANQVLIALIADTLTLIVVSSGALEVQAAVAGAGIRPVTDRVRGPRQHRCDLRRAPGRVARPDERRGAGRERCRERRARRRVRELVHREAG